MSNTESSPILDPEDRTPPLGLFNYARSYWISAEQLRSSKPNVSHADAVICFLFYHAIELYLKSYLKAAGFDLHKLKKLSHGTSKIGETARKEGLNLSNEDYETLQLIDSYDNVVRSRYIVTGAFSRPEDHVLAELCEHLDATIGNKLRAEGLPARTFEVKQARPKSSDLDEDELADELESLSAKEREIIAYLLMHNQRMFTCALDGGHASTLISRGIVRVALIPNQAFGSDDMPVEIPSPIWRFLKVHRSNFPCDDIPEDAPHPWRKSWMEM